MLRNGGCQGALPGPMTAITPSSHDPRPRGTIQSVERALALLAAVARARTPPTLAEVAAACGLGRTTAWRLLATLEAHGLVTRDPTSGGYVVGPAAAVLAGAVDEATLIRLARPALEQLAADIGETASLALPRRIGLFYVEQVDPPERSAASWLGIELSLHATSSGKALLAHLPPAEREAVLSRPLRRFTPATITDRRSLAAELDETVRRGYATCAGELEEREFGVSSPVLDAGGHPVCVVNVWGPMKRVPASRFAELGERVRQAAAVVAGAITL